MKNQHLYKLTLSWTGNKGTGTSDYIAYERSHTIFVENKELLQMSSDPAFRGDKSKYNPEELFLASIASCHMLWFLHLCADNGIIVNDYIDNPVGIMAENENGIMKFIEVTLNPIVTIKEKILLNKLDELHHQANKECFIANSVNFPIKHNHQVRF